jgi:dihydropteroate synthase
VDPRPIFDLALPGGRTIRLGERTLVMGVLNVTPDSFADGGRPLDPDRSVEDGLRMAGQGADLIDVGGESTRPGAVPLPAEEERRRVVPVIRRLASRLALPISVDTYKAEVARAALADGATIVNDMSALRYDPAIADVVAEARAGLILMHSRGRSRQMYREAVYRDVAREVIDELRRSLDQAMQAGVPHGSILLDPGLGFAKRADQSFEALGALHAIGRLGCPIVVGPSRKSFLTAAIGDVPPPERVWATAAAVTAAVMLGAHVVRVHDVEPMVVVRVADRVRATIERASPDGEHGACRDE